MRSKFRALIFVQSFLLLLSLTGCMSFGKKFPSQTAWIEKGETSQRDVQELLGNPYSVGNSDGTLVWTYLFSQYSLGEPLHQKELKIYWNAQNRVKFFQFNSSFPSDLEKYSMTRKENKNKKEKVN